MADSPLQTEQQRISSVPLVQGSSSRRLSWRALFSGVLVAVAVHTILTLLGVGIGAVTLTGDVRGGGSALGASLWVAVGTVIAYYGAGWTSGRLAGIPRAVESTMHGFLCWCLAMTIGIGLAMASGGISAISAGLGRAAVPAILTPGAGMIATAPPATPQPLSPTDLNGPVPAEVRAARAQARQALAGFFVMILGAGAATLGGFVSTPVNTILTSLPAWERRRAR
jgi:hypothetical protein